MKFKNKKATVLVAFLYFLPNDPLRIINEVLLLLYLHSLR